MIYMVVKNIRLMIVPIFLFVILGCNKYSTVHKDRQMADRAVSDTIFPVFYGIEAPVDNPPGKVVSLDLTLDKNENIRRVKSIPGFDTLSKKDQIWLLDLFTSLVPDTISERFRLRERGTIFNTDSCTSVNLGAASCPEVIVTYHQKCPAGLVFDEKLCLCDFPDKAPEGASNCFTTFQFSQSGYSYVKLKSGWWNLTAASGYPNWCSVSGCTLHL